VSGERAGVIGTGGLMGRSFAHDVPASRVVFANGAIAEVPAELERLGCVRPLLIHGRHEAAYADAVAALLDGRLAGRFSDVAMHVPVAVAAAAERETRASGADGLVALGGGSATGLAKAVAVATGLPILAVPTTYSGSEMTDLWGRTESGRKVTARDVRARPRAVVYDPELTLSLPPSVSAASGMNAVAHLVEGLYSPGVSPVAMLEAEAGLRTLAEALPRVVADPADLAARGDALVGAWLAGWILGTTGMGVHHRVCHILGGAYDLPHAQTHSAVIAQATAFNAAYAPEAMAAIVRALNDAGLPTTDAAQGIWDLARVIGSPTSLRDVGFDSAAIDTVAGLVAASRPTNPRPVDIAGVRSILAAACEGTRPPAHEEQPWSE
jgi:maleylacetate reductase